LLSFPMIGRRRKPSKRKLKRGNHVA